MAGLLARLGYQPAKPGGRELLYRSMLRDGDRTPSFSVNDALGVWYDHGTGKGGNVIDFGLAYWPDLTFKDVVQKIWEVAQQPVPTVAVSLQPAGRRRRAQKLPHYQVEEVKSLCNNPQIRHYLENRGVLHLAKGRLQEVYYVVEDEKHQRKHFFAAGHQNELGGWEVRNKYFKGCLGKKALTIIIECDARRVVLFEGYFDYLGWLHEHPEDKPSIIVLNSLSLLEAAMKVAMRYPQIDCFFDHDKPGRQATRTLLKALPYASDRSAIYKGHHDYNDKRKSDARDERGEQKPRDIFKGIKVPFER